VAAGEWADDRGADEGVPRARRLSGRYDERGKVLEILLSSECEFMAWLRFRVTVVRMLLIVTIDDGVDIGGPDEKDADNHYMY
jgi:hypothetical protein